MKGVSTITDLNKWLDDKTFRERTNQIEEYYRRKIMDQIYISSARQNGKSELERMIDKVTMPFMKITSTNIPQPKKIIQNNPATIVYWYDGTKTVVKVAEGDTFIPEIGVAMAYMKKIHGTNRAFKRMIKDKTK